MQRLLSLPYEDATRAQREIEALADSFPPAIRDRFDMLLAASPDPELGLHYFARLREQQHIAFERITRSTAGMRHLVAIFTYSRFLSEEILEHPERADELRDASGLQRALTDDALRTRLENALPPGLPHPLELAKFRRRQLLRIVVRDVLGLGTLAEITAELSSLADVLIESAYDRIHQDLLSRYGTPRSDVDGSEAHFAVIALGKLGGNELNYSSDIDLMFLYSDPGYTDGAERITNKEFFKRAANQLTALLSAYTAEGMCYRVDLRLRPDGSLGEVCLSLDGARTYYERRARDWELQMLIKARVAAGHQPTGRALLDFVEPRTYSTTLDFSAVEQLSLTRERLNEKLAARQAKRGMSTRIRERGNSIDVKLDRGGIRDIEFVVQCLQRLHGGADPWVRHGGTLLALARLQDKGYLSGAEYGRLAAAYQFLRHLEHRLQFEDDLQTHILPEDFGARELLARRMPGGGSLREPPVDWLMRELRGHFQHVRQIYERVVHSRSAPVETAAQPRTSNIVLALDQRAPALASALTRAKLHHGHRAFEHFPRALVGRPGAPEPAQREPGASGSNPGCV